jgi:hypothetical protein
MARFTVRRNVRARFGKTDLGVVTDLDIGEFHDLTEPPEQFYVFCHEIRQEVVRFVAGGPSQSIVGALRTLVLNAEGAEYRVEALCSGASPHAHELTAYTFEAQGTAQVRECARQRHGVDCLATALLLDALRRDD